MHRLFRHYQTAAHHGSTQEVRIRFCALEALRCIRHDEIIGVQTSHISKQAFQDAISVSNFNSSFFALLFAAPGFKWLLANRNTAAIPLCLTSDKWLRFARMSGPCMCKTRVSRSTLHHVWLANGSYLTCSRQVANSPAH